MTMGLIKMRLVVQCAVLAAILCGLLIPAGAKAQEMEQTDPSLNIPAQNAEDAVKALARTHRRSVLFQTEDVAAINTKPLEGNYSLQRALDEMFEGTSLVGGLTENGVITVSLRKTENLLGGTSSMEKKKSVSATRKSRLFLSPALTAIAASMTVAANAQDSDSTDTEDTIIVVGTQIKGADIAGALPVTVLNAEDIELTGAINGEELFESIPQFGGVTFNGVGFAGVNGARGDIASVNLRAIGTGNTLVLLNGRRLVLHPGTQVQNFVPVVSVNTNALPVTGIQRVEVLRDGAAALYGTDAVAGVVNTVLKNDFEGLAVNFQYGGSEGTDLRELNANFEAGISLNDGRTNISLFGNFLDRNGMPASQLLNSSTEDLRVFFEGTEFEGDTQLRNLSTQTQFGEFRSLDGTIAALGDDDFHIQPQSLAGCLVDLPGGVCADNGGTIDTDLRLDRAGFRDLVGDTQRGNAFLFINHEVSKEVELYGEFSYYRSSFSRQRERSAILSSNRIVVPSTNFYNPFGVDLEIRDLRALDTGRRQINVDNESFRILGGLRGDLEDGWSYDSAVLFTEAETKDRTSNRISNTLFQQSLALDTPDAYNPFGGGNIDDFNLPNFSNNSQATIDTFLIDVARDSRTTLLLADFKMSNADLFQLPAGNLGVAVGLEARRETFSDDRDDRLDGTITFTDSVTGRMSDSDVLGSSPTPDTRGGRNVYSAFVEVGVPVISPEMGIPLVHSIDLQIAARGESFTDTRDAIKPKVALSWYPFEWMQMRGAYSRGFRAPNLEQINANGIRRVNAGREDWIGCEAASIANATAFDVGDCDGVSIESVRSGGPDLQPEDSQNYSGGVVLSPFNGLTLTADYWRVETINTVGLLGDQDQLSLDYFLRLAGSSNPNVVRLDPDADQIALFTAAGLAPAGDVIEVIDDYVNLGPREAEGLDFAAYYDINAGSLGDFNFKVNVAHLLTFFQEPSSQEQALLDAIADGTLNDAVDVGGAASLVRQNGQPEWRGSASMRWEKGPFGFGAFARYVGSVTDTSVTSSLGNQLEIGSFYSVNLSVDYTLENAGFASNSRLRFGVRNVTDQAPPLADEFATGYFEELHSNRGRYWFASVRKQF